MPSDPSDPSDPQVARPPAPPQLRVLLLVALLCLVWGSTWWAIRLCLRDQPPLSSAALRFLIAGAAMLLLAPRLRRAEAAPPPPRWLWVIAGATNFAISYGVIYTAEQFVSSGIAAVLWSSFSLLMAASAVLFLGERLRPLQVLGFLISFLGIVAVGSGDLGGDTSDPGAAMLLLVSPVVAAIGTTLVKKYGSGTSSVLLNRNGMVLGALLLAGTALLFEDPAVIVWTWSGTFATLYLALFGTVLTFGVYFWLLRTAPASTMALISYMAPILAMLLGALVGDGVMGSMDWIGAALVVTGIACVLRRQRP